METSNKFKADFKYYKQRCPPPDYCNVLDFSNVKNQAGIQKVELNNSLQENQLGTDEAFVASLMKTPSEWDVYEILEKPGLLFITNPFTSVGQRYWIYRCLKDYTCSPSRLNIDAHNIIGNSQNWWESCQGEDENCHSVRKKLRWATLGYHHNWDTKVYSEDMKDPFPCDLAALSKYVCRAVYCQKDFIAEAAIVNFYHFDSTLSGHTDHSEMDMTAPLLSFSFGQPAVFLLGGVSLDIAPTAMFIKSGDILIMSKDTRQCYHGVPKILAAQEFPWDTELLVNDMDFVSKQASIDSCDDGSSEDKPCLSLSLKLELPKSLSNQNFWKPFQNYIRESRINMNVRQVLCEGMTVLNDNRS